MAQQWWEQDQIAGQGQPAPATGGGMTIQTRPADPRIAAREDRAVNADTRASEAAARAADAAARDAQNDALSLRLKQIELQKASQPAKADTEKQARTARLRALEQQLSRVDQLYGQNLRGGAPNQLNRLVPDIFNPTLGQFDSSAAGLAEQALWAFRVPGVGSQSDAELRAFVNANQPQSTDSDLRIEEKLGNIRRRIQAELGNLEPQAAAGANNTTGAAALPAMPQSTLPPSSPTPTIDPSGNREFSTEYDKAFASEAQAAFNAGATRDQMNEIAKKYGAQPFGADLEQAIQSRNAGGRAQFTTPVTGREAAGLTGQLFGAAAATPVGSYGMGALNAMTMGTLDEMVGAAGGNATATQVAKDLAARENPLASMLGNVTGGALAVAAPEAAMSRMGIGGATGVMAPRLMATDAAYGAAFGAGENNDDRLSGALTGGISGALGGTVGRGAVSGTGMAFRGVRDAGVRRLQEAGVPMTMGQIMSQSGRVGQMVKGVEDRLAGLPLVGDLINARRTQGLEGFNRAAFNEALAPIQGTVDQVAEGGIQQAQQAVSGAYDNALGGVRVQADPQFVQDMAAARARATGVPNHGQGLGYTLDNNVGNLFDDTGGLTGERLQAAIQTLRGEAPAYSGQPLGNEAAGSLRQAEDALTGLVVRQAPDVMPALGSANQAYRNLRILEDAVGDSGKNTGGLFTPAQLGMKSAQNTKSYGGKAANARGDRPFFELQRAGQDILPSKVPDSGTAGRLALPAILGGAGAGAGYLGGDTQTGAALGLLAAAPASRTGQRLIQDALLRRSPEMVRIGDTIVNRSRLGGMFGAPLSVYLASGGGKP